MCVNEELLDICLKEYNERTKDVERMNIKRKTIFEIVEARWGLKYYSFMKKCYDTMFEENLMRDIYEITLEQPNQDCMNKMIGIIIQQLFMDNILSSCMIHDFLILFMEAVMYVITTIVRTTYTKTDVD